MGAGRTVYDPGGEGRVLAHVDGAEPLCADGRSESAHSTAALGVRPHRCCIPTEAVVRAAAPHTVPLMI
jgi:hypothetical protein